jgi:hypothetical protein
MLAITTAVPYTKDRMFFSRKKKDKDGYLLRPSRLDGLSGLDYDREAERIVQEYGRVVAEVSAKRSDIYPAFVFPASILPASKKDITEAVELFLDPGMGLPAEIVESIRICYVLLDSFIEDEDAKWKNLAYIGQKNK